MKFVLASNNKKKIREMSEILAPMGIELVSQSEAGLELEVPETGVTFEENAVLKAEAAASALGLPAIADDSGLEVMALGGEPGVYSARYGGLEQGSDEDRYRLLLSRLRGVHDRRARFVSCIVCAMPDGKRLVSEGCCEGEILEQPRGDGGFGYDPVFLPIGSEKSMAELTAQEKHAISHRGRALAGFKTRLKEYLLVM